MPIPKPNSGKSQDKFIGRCMGSNLKKKEYSDQKQRAAVCYSSQSKSHGSDDKYEVVNFKLTQTNFLDIETEEVDGGLLIKHVPVFKTGTYRDKRYTEKYVDEKLIGNFKVDNNLPVQADHSESYNDTLGYVKNLAREGKMLFADMLLLADNAISRWKKGLMKKWSASIYLNDTGLREISAVAFPYVSEASLLGENPDHVVKERKAGPEIKKEIIYIEADGLRKDLDGKDAKIKYSKKDNCYSIILDSDSENAMVYDEKTMTFSWDTAYIDSLPDSAFALVKDPVKDKSTDRALPYKNIDGKINATHLRNALAGFNQIKGFSSDEMAGAKDALIDTAKEARIKVSETFMEEVTNMDEKKIDELAELKAEKMLEDAAQKEQELSDKVTEVEGKVEELSKEKVDLEKKLTESEIKDKIAALKADGKILPAEEEKVISFALKLDEEARTEYFSMLEKVEKKVELSEEGEQKSEKNESKIKDEFAIDLNEASPDEIEALVGKYAEKEGIPVDDARDIVYERNMIKEEKENK